MGLSALRVAGALCIGFILVLLRKYVGAKRILSSLRSCPGGSILWQHPFRMAVLVTGNYFPPKGWMGNFHAGFSFYAENGSTCLSSVTFWDALPVIWLSDADAIRSIQTQRQIFPKDIEPYGAMNIYGQAIVGAEGSEWKRHRSVANSAFNESNNAFVWQETFRIVNEWFSDIDSQMRSEKEVTIHLLNTLTRVTLLVISSAGFGRRISWDEESNTEPPPGHDRTFQDAISSTLKYMLTKVLIPNWIHCISSKIYLPFISSLLKESRDSFDALKAYMLDVIGSARDWIANGKSFPMEAALLRNLVEANMVEDEKGAKCLSDDELLSDTFNFFTAGQETSSHTLCFAILLLAVYPEVQQQAFEEVRQLWPNTAQHSIFQTSYKQSITQLQYISAIFYETLRLFTPAPRLGKQIMGDTVIKARRFSTTSDGKISDVEEYDVSVPAGGLMLIDVLGLHMNPIHWGPDVAEFKPERFIDSETYRWPRDAFQGFSSGPRNCLGQRFAHTESVCILARLVHKYEICVPEELKDKSFAERKAIMLKWKPGLTTVPLYPNVRLRLRN